MNYYTQNNTTSQQSIGTNLAKIRYWSTQLPFIDSFKSSSPWITQSNNNSNTQEDNILDLDENGWLKSLSPIRGSAKYTKVSTILHRGTQGNYPGGKYLVLYEGEGKLNYKHDASIDLTASQPGRDVINVTPTNKGILLTITETDPNNTGNYIRNIRVIPFAYKSNYQTEIFNPLFIEKIRHYHAIRFMNWQETNNSPEIQWSSRPTISDYHWSTGVPVEIMVELANILERDPWFNMPHQATDEYITKFAEYVRDNLNPGLNVYVEYSNEVWNGMFEQNSWVEKQVKKDSTFKGNSANWFGKRTTEITQIWDKVFNVTGQKERVIGVMGGQGASVRIIKQALDYRFWSNEDKTHTDYGIDAIAIAPYFGRYIAMPQNKSTVEKWTVDQLFEELTKGGKLNNSPRGGAVTAAYEQMQEHIALAKKENLQLLAYEGGQHLGGHGTVKDSQRIQNLFLAANRDPRMGELYKEYFTCWNQQGGNLFMHFLDIQALNSRGNTQFGALEFLNQDGSPKHNAIKELILDPLQKLKLTSSISNCNWEQNLLKNPNSSQSFQLSFGYIQLIPYFFLVCLIVVIRRLK